MARPQKVGLDYFPHDTDAANDEKIEAMRAAHGNDGYAFYFILLERIFHGENSGINLRNDLIRGAVAKMIGIDTVKFDTMIRDSLEIGLFDKYQFESNGVLTSNGIQKRFASIATQREKWRNKKVFPLENPEKKEGKQDENPENSSKYKKKNINIDICAFDTFWRAFPRRVNKQKAQKAFEKINPDDELLALILEKLVVFKNSVEWQRDGGCYIPHASTWLNNKRWEDEMPDGAGQQFDDVI